MKEIMKNGQIVFTAEDGSEETFFVLEEAKIAGETYLLVSESAEEDSNALILKQMMDEEMMLDYEVLDDENELAILSKYFEELLDNIDLEIK